MIDINKLIEDINQAKLKLPTVELLSEFDDSQIRIAYNKGLEIAQDLIRKHSEPVSGEYRTYPHFLSDDEKAALLQKAEYLFQDLQDNQLGGFSGINRPFWIVSKFREVIEEFGNRDTGQTWSPNELNAHPQHKNNGVKENGK